MTYLFLQDAGFFGQIINGLTNITGSLFLTLLYILIFFVVIALAMQIPLEWISVIYLPMCISLVAYTSDFLAIFGCLLIYLAFVVAQHLFQR